MVDLLADDLTGTQRSQLLHGAVVPRPIAWITTQRDGGPVNLAPFSCYTYICGTPPLVLIAVGSREGRLKDTLENILSTGEFVINSVECEFVTQVAQSAWDYSADAGEAAALCVKLEASLQVKVPRLANAAVSLECILDRLIPVGDTAGHNLLIGQVRCYRIRDELFRDGKIDVNKFLPVGRLGGPHYVSLGNVMHVPVKADERKVIQAAAGGSSPEEVAIMPCA